MSKMYKKVVEDNKEWLKSKIQKWPTLELHTSVSLHVLDFDFDLEN